MPSIPISEAKRIADERGFDQVIIVGRKVGEDGVEHVATYGDGTENCDVAARAGMAIKHHLMQWPHPLWSGSFRVLGAGRDERNIHVVNVVLQHPVSDDDIRLIHEFLKPNTASPKEIAEGA